MAIYKRQTTAPAIAAYINPRIPLQRQFVADILTTAIEGGSNYWLACRRIVRAEQGEQGLEALSPIKVEGIYDAETGNAFEVENYAAGLVPPLAAAGKPRNERITLETIVRGIERAFSDLSSLPSHARPHLSGANYEAILTNGVHGDYDAYTADVLLQLGLFGQVVYG